MLGGGYLYFSGKDSVTVQSLFTEAPNRFTYEFWAKPEAEILLPPQGPVGVAGNQGQSYVISAEHGSDANQAGIGVSVGTNGIVLFEHTLGHLPPVLVASLSIHDWIHIAVVYEDRTPSLFVNGELHKKGIPSYKSIVYPCGNFGALEPYGYYVGGIDDIRIWKNARSVEQINALMHVELTGSEKDLLGCWSFNEDTPNLALDRTNHKHHGKIKGAQVRVRHSMNTIQWEGIYPRFITNHLDYLERYCFTDANREQIQQIVQNTRHKGYRTDVLMMFNVYRHDYDQLYSPVADELIRRGRSVALALPQEAGDNPLSVDHKVSMKWIHKAPLADSMDHLAEVYYEEHINPILSQWFRSEGIPNEQQAWLKSYYQQYAADFMEMTALLNETRPKCVYGLHFILNPGYLDAIHNMRGQTPIYILLMQHGFLFGDGVDSHDFKGADRVLLWGDYHKTFLDRKTDARPSVPVGNPKIEYVYEQLERKRRSSPSSRKRPKILYISADSPKRSNRSKENFELVVEALNSLKGINVTYKLHPVEEFDDYKEYVSQKKIINTQLSKGNIYDLFLESDLVIGDNSSSVFEAAALGIPAIQIYLPHQDATHIVFTKATSAESLKRNVERAITDPAYRSSLLSSQKVWIDQMFGEIKGSTQRVVDIISKYLS